MRLADLRRLSIERETRIRFPVAGGLECVVTERGIAQVPALRGIPAFNLERELAVAREFHFEPAGPSGRNRASAASLLTRAEVARLLAPTPSTAATEHEED
jgi:hypothetical protein